MCRNWKQNTQHDIGFSLTLKRTDMKCIDRAGIKTIYLLGALQRSFPLGAFTLHVENNSQKLLTLTENKSHANMCIENDWNSVNAPKTMRFE